LNSSTHVLMAGCGNMGGALLLRWLDQANFKFTVVSPSGRSCPEGVDVVRDVNDLAGKQFDLIIIAVKPQMINDVLPDYTNLLADNGCFVSIAAGFSAASIGKLIGDRSLVRVMPNMPVSTGQGVSAMHATDTTTGEQRELVTQLMNSTGKLIWVDDEDSIDRITAIAGSGPGYAFELARCWIEAGQSLGFSEAEARQMVLQTLIGSIGLALDSDKSLAQLRDGVTSKNGTTAAGLAALNRDNSLDALFKQTVDAAYARAVELR